MRRFASLVRSREAVNHDERHVSARDIRAIRHAIADAPTPGLRADLMAAAVRQGIDLGR